MIRNAEYIVWEGRDFTRLLIVNTCKPKEAPEREAGGFFAWLASTGFRWMALLALAWRYAVYTSEAAAAP